MPIGKTTKTDNGERVNAIARKMEINEMMGMAYIRIVENRFSFFRISS